MARTDYYHAENSPAPNSIVAAASAVVIDEEGRILLHRRKDNDFWSLLGGAMEAGESIEETAIREVKEESGLNVNVTRLVGIYTDPRHIIEYSNGEIRQQFSICFECNPVSGTLRISSESKELRFFHVSEIDSIKIHPAQLIRIQDQQAMKKAAFIR